MAKSTTNNQKYLIIERYVNRDDWSFFSREEYDSVEQAMADINKVVTQDPEYYADIEYKIAAINEFSICVVQNVTCNLEIHKD